MEEEWKRYLMLSQGRLSDNTRAVLESLLNEIKGELYFTDCPDGEVDRCYIDIDAVADEDWEKDGVKQILVDGHNNKLVVLRKDGDYFVTENIIGSKNKKNDDLKIIFRYYDIDKETSKDLHKTFDLSDDFNADDFLNYYNASLAYVGAVNTLYNPNVVYCNKEEGKDYQILHSEVIDNIPHSSAFMHLGKNPYPHAYEAYREYINELNIKEIIDNKKENGKKLVKTK